MAVTTTAIAGTDSLSGSRITINDNFKTLEDALNSILSAFDIVSGRFDNSAYGSANDILTNGLTINGTSLTDALLINSGDLNMVNGNIKLAETSHLVIGSLLELDQFNLEETSSPGAYYPTWDLRSPGGTSDTVGGVVLPILTGAGYSAVGPTSSIPIGTMVMTEEGPGASAPLRLWWDNGAGATWWKIEMTL